MQNSLLSHVVDPLLLQIQLKDPNFIRYILIQILIFLNAAKFTAVAKHVGIQDLVEKSVSKLERKVNRLLEMFGEKDNTNITNNIHTLFNSNTEWIDWKNNKCKKMLPDDAKTGTKRKRNEPFKPRKRAKYDISSERISEVWQTEVVLDYLMDTKTPEEAIETAIDDVNYAPNLSYSLLNNKPYHWKTCRLMKSQLSKYEDCHNEDIFKQKIIDGSTRVQTKPQTNGQEELKQTQEDNQTNENEPTDQQTTQTSSESKDQPNNEDTINLEQSNDIKLDEDIVLDDA